MKTQRKIFIADYGNRAQSMGLPYHYSKLGHRVYMLKPGEFESEWNWSKIPVWPRLLHKPDPDSSSRNLEYFSDIDVKFGEDSFLPEEREEILRTTYSSNSHVTLVTEKDLETLGKDIDIFHTTEFCIDVLDHRLSWAQKFLPNAKWISSCFNPFHVGKGHPGNKDPDNVCILMPSPCENMFPEKNRFHMFRHEFEFDLLGVRDHGISRDKNLITSFMHNFHVRDPEYYKIFLQLQDLFASVGVKIVNYGGNIRSVGADVRYSGGGPSGSNFETLSVRKSCFKYFESRAVLHMKGLDWAGGVPAHAQMSKTPLITVEPFIVASNYKKFYNSSTGTVITRSAEELVRAIEQIVKNDDLFSDLSEKIYGIGNIMFDDSYWNRFDSFVERSCSS